MPVQGLIVTPVVSLPQDRVIVLVSRGSPIALRTGGSASATISRLKQDGVTRIKLLCIVAAPKGIKTIEDEHPDVKIFCATVDRELNENAYILPGLGDAGDRVYGTK